METDDIKKLVETGIAITIIAMFVIVISIAIAGCHMAGRDVDYGRVVDCIAKVENGVPWKPGGVLCWTKAAWMEETNLDYGYSVDYSISRVLAISRLSRQSQSNKRNTINEMASLWRWGANGPRTSTYGQRVENLYRDQ